MNQLSNTELVALAGAVKGKALDDAKAAIADGASETVDFSVRISGSIQKGFRTGGGSYTQPASVTMANLPAFCAALRVMGVGGVRLRRALESLDPSAIEVDAELSAIFDEVAREKAAKLPAVKGFASGKAGAVQSQITFERVTA